MRSGRPYGTLIRISRHLSSWGAEDRGSLLAHRYKKSRSRRGVRFGISRLPRVCRRGRLHKMIFGVVGRKKSGRRPDSAKIRHVTPPRHFGPWCVLPKKLAPPPCRPTWTSSPGPPREQKTTVFFLCLSSIYSYCQVGSLLALWELEELIPTARAFKR